MVMLIALVHMHSFQKFQLKGSLIHEFSSYKEWGELAIFKITCVVLDQYRIEV